MSGPKVTAAQGAVAVGGDNTGPIAIAPGGTINLLFQPADSGFRLTSLLGKVIVHFSQEELSHYGEQPHREVLPEIEQKIAYNYLTDNDLLLREYRMYSGLLEKSYRGVEQSNADVRRLVRRRAAAAYSHQLTELCAAAGVGPELRSEHARSNAHQLIERVMHRMLADYASSDDIKVDFEYAQMAVRLVVADAIFECEVLEKPANVVAA